MRRFAATLQCSNGTNCVAYRTLGEPAKLSRGNPGPWCFACEERRAAVEVETAAAKSKDERSRKANPSRSSRGQLRRSRGRTPPGRDQGTTDHRNTAGGGHPQNGLASPGVTFSPPMTLRPLAARGGAASNR